MLDFLKNKKNKSRFSLLYKIVKSKDLKFATDNKSYFIAESGDGKPIWIWVSDEFDFQNANEFMFVFKDFVSNENVYRITTTPEIYELIRQDSNYDINNYFEMGAYYCEKVVKPNEINCKLLLATKEDIDVLTHYRLLEIKELEGFDEDYDKVYFELEQLIEKQVFYVLKVGDKIVCTAAINVLDEFARINRVYTPVNERCKGYAKFLIYNLTKQVIAQNLIPVLYTDFNYLASNKAYLAVGYEDVGKLISFSLKRIDI